MKAMKHVTAGCIASLLLTGAALTYAQDRESPQAAESTADVSKRFEDQYAILSRNNIFVRDRRPAPPPSQGPTTQQAPPAAPLPERDWVLIGVVFEDGRFRAYFENVRGQPTTRAVVGDRIADGLIDQVYLDAVAYQHNGQLIWVDIGQDLTGARPSGASASNSPDGSTAGTADDGAESAGENVDPSSLSLEERMRLRRQQEGGRP